MSGFLIIKTTKPIINYLNSTRNMKKIILLMITVIGFNLSSWSQPDYTKITFRSKLPQYKKKKPDLKGANFNKDQIKNIIYLLGNSFYSENEIEDITEKVWLSFNDPKKFDFVFKDLAIRTIPNWNKKNVRGLIVVEPNPFLAEWTLADGESPYFQRALSMILSYYNLMKYSDDAKSTKKSLGELLYTQNMSFRPVKTSDWTNTYLNSANIILAKKNLTCLVANGQYEYFVCEIDKKSELLKLFKKLDWKFIDP